MSPPVKLPSGTVPVLGSSLSSDEIVASASEQAPPAELEIPLVKPTVRQTSWAAPRPPEKPPSLAAGLDRQPGFLLLPEQHRPELHAAFQRANSEERMALVNLLRAPEFGSLVPEQRGQLMTMACAVVGAPSERAGNSYRLSESRVPVVALAIAFTSGQLMKQGSDGKMALEHLQRLCSAPLNVAVAQRLSPDTSLTLLVGLLQEIADPRRIDQGVRDTCTVTSIQSFMAMDMPGEYARLCVGLALDGEVSMANGETMPADCDGIERSGLGARSPSERVFQASLMQFSTRTAANYVSLRDGREGFVVNTKSQLWDLPTLSIILSFVFFWRAINYGLTQVPDELNPGLTAEPFEVALRAITNEPYSKFELATQENMVAALAKIRPSLHFEGDNIVVVVFMHGTPHAMVLLGVDTSSTPPALLCRDARIPLPGKQTGDAIYPLESARYEDVPVTYEDAAAGIVRCPLVNAGSVVPLFAFAPTRLLP